MLLDGLFICNLFLMDSLDLHWSFLVSELLYKPCYGEEYSSGYNSAIRMA